MGRETDLGEILEREEHLEGRAFLIITTI